MEYTDKERRILSLMESADFKNLSKNDFISYASKLNELRPEVATQVLTQYPEFVKLIQSSMVEYKDILEKVIASDNESIQQFYTIADKELESIDQSRKEFYEFAGKVHSDLSKCLDNPNLTDEKQREILSQEMEIVRIVDQKDKEIREQEMKIVNMANQKDKEKREFNGKVIGAASTIVIVAVGIGASVLGGNFNIKLPKKS